MQSFTAPQVAAAIEVDYFRLREWLRKGQLKPSLREAAGRGTTALFSRQEVYLAALFKYMVAHGFHHPFKTTFRSQEIILVILACYGISKSGYTIFYLLSIHEWQMIHLVANSIIKAQLSLGCKGQALRELPDLTAQARYATW